jgi:hypothetical protein
MMRQIMVAAAAALALAACNQQGSGPALPRVQPGAQAPVALSPPQNVPQHQITNEVRQQLLAQIDQLLDQYATQFAAGMGQPEGFTDQIAPMQPGTDHRFVMPLQAGSNYTFLGACDGDCTNVDIELIDMTTGGVVSSDMLPDDYPVVNFTPPGNGQYMVRLILQNCSAAPCFAGARAYVQSAGDTGKSGDTGK